MKILKILVISLLILLGVAIPILVTDLYWMWIPFLSHTEEYPVKLSALFMAVSALITLLLAFTAVRSIEESNKREQRDRKDNQTREDRDRQERRLKEIIEWATDIIEIPAQMSFVVWREIISMSEPKRSVYLENMTRQNVMELRRRYTILTEKECELKYFPQVLRNINWIS